MSKLSLKEALEKKSAPPPLCLQTGQQDAVANHGQPLPWRERAVRGLKRRGWESTDGWLAGWIVATIKKALVVCDTLGRSSGRERMLFLGSASTN